MFLFKSHEGIVTGGELLSLGGGTAPLPDRWQRLWHSLSGEEKPRDMLTWLTILVLVAHVWLILRLQQPVEKLVDPQPLPMEVTLIATPLPQNNPAPAPAPPVVEKKTPPPPKPKPVIKKAEPVVKKQAAPTPVEPTPTEQIVTSPSAASSSYSVPAAPPTPPAPPVETFVEPNYKANYAENPKPTYPSIARSRGWQGKVLLKVDVSVDGLSETVAVQQSSGHESLDEAAVEAVKKWKFIPAKRGDKAVASAVIVPIIFKLDN